MTPTDTLRDYKPCTIEAAIDRCPVCAHAAILLEYTAGTDDDGRTFVVSCDSPAPESVEDFECPMNPAPYRFHRERKTEAIEAWNDFAKRAKAARKKNAPVRIDAARGKEGSR
jgi:hypothetical protein